jgi:tetratricopeptide (TPR) repeat protein
MRVRTIGSLDWEKRARFAALRETMVALAERIRTYDEESLGEVRTGFRELMFPIPLRDSPALGYGFFSRMDLVGGGGVEVEALLAPFTAEVQAGLGEARFLDAAEAMLFGRPLPQGAALDQFYDPQLAALANYLFNNGRYAAAADVFGLLVRRDATSALRHRGLALTLLATGRFGPAAEAARKSLTLAAGWPDEIILTGSNFQDVFPSPRDLAEMRDELAAQLAARPDDADLGFLMAWVDIFHGKWDAAEERLARLAETDDVAAGLLARLQAGAVDPTIRRPTASVLQAYARDLTGLEEPGLEPEVRKHLVEVLRQGPDSFEDYMRLGDYRFFMGDYTRAAEAYRSAHQASERDPFALFALAHASFANGESRLAARYLRAALSIEPGWGLYEFRIEEFYGDRAEFEQHVENLERHVRLRPDESNLKFLLAYVYYFSGRYADATELLAEVVRQDPDFPRADQLLRLARVQG